MQAEEHDQQTAEPPDDPRHARHILPADLTNQRGRDDAQQHKDDGEPEHERQPVQAEREPFTERARRDSGSTGAGLHRRDLGVLERTTAQITDIGRHKRQHTRRDERDQAEYEGDREGNFKHWISDLTLRTQR